MNIINDIEIIDINIYREKTTNPNDGDIYLDPDTSYLYEYKKEWKKMVVFDVEESKRIKYVEELRRERIEKLSKLNEKYR